ncbi:hypothetical protein HQO42_13705 [Rhodococcus fascians]|nr:hypothetical protein [Rhodococcus fascians]MBY4239556.1 hypothetical protein [Rhodococcus fascians]MBY4253712.1 hypothetical protein [Rhodococcus fascians]MBY4271145.1 hypothetical protein [Rhodococcus fascians]
MPYRINEADAELPEPSWASLDDELNYYRARRSMLTNIVVGFLFGWLAIVVLMIIRLETNGTLSGLFSRGIAALSGLTLIGAVLTIIFSVVGYFQLKRSLYREQRSVSSGTEYK